MVCVSRDRCSPDKHYIGNVKECIVSMIYKVSEDAQQLGLKVYEPQKAEADTILVKITN